MHFSVKWMKTGRIVMKKKVRTMTEAEAVILSTVKAVGCCGGMLIDARRKDSNQDW